MIYENCNVKNKNKTKKKSICKKDNTIINTISNNENKSENDSFDINFKFNRLYINNNPEDEQNNYWKELFEENFKNYNFININSSDVNKINIDNLNSIEENYLDNSKNLSYNNKILILDKIKKKIKKHKIMIYMRIKILY